MTIKTLQEINEIILNLLYNKADPHLSGENTTEPILTAEEIEILNSIEEFNTDFEFDITLHANVMREMKNLKILDIGARYSQDTIYKIENISYAKNLTTLKIDNSEIENMQLNLPNLQYLELSCVSNYTEYNIITKRRDEAIVNLDISKCPKIETIELRGTKINLEQINLPKLKTLILSDNGITDNRIKDLTPLTKFTQLIKLTIKDMPMSNHSLPSLPNLKILLMSKTKITDIQDILDKCPELTELAIFDEVIPVIQLFKSHNNLIKLILYNNQIQVIENLDRMLPNLKKLEISYNKLTNLKGIPTGIDKLCAYKNNITNINDIKVCENIQGLHLSGNKISDIEVLKYLPKLFNLSIKNNKITEIDDLKDCINLKFLYLNENPIKSIAPIASLKLEQLSIDKDHKITDLNLINPEIIKYI